MTGEALIFDVEKIRFGLWTKAVKQVLQAATISKLPGASSLLEGIINLYGHVVPVLNFRELFQLPAKQLEVTDHFLVVALANRDVVLRVDRALDLINLDLDGPAETQANIGGVACFHTIATTSYGLIHVIETNQLLSIAGSSRVFECLKM